MGEWLVRLDSETKTLIRWRLVAASFMVFLYHGGNAIGETITGEAATAAVYVSWEYDLETGLGEVHVYTSSVISNERVGLRGVIPDQAINVQVNGESDVDLIQCCGFYDVCPDGSDDPQAVSVLAVPDTVQNTITFEVENPQLFGPVLKTMRAGTLCMTDETTTCSAAAFCSFERYLGTIKSFVTIAPLECQTGNFDNDSDVDLLDFARFQQLFTGPR